MNKNARLLIHIEGQVQGIGFRPHVARLAQRFKLTGFVYNQNGNVVVEIQGPKTQLNLFLDQLKKDKTVPCCILSLNFQEIPLQEDESPFYIKKSCSIGEVKFIPNDLAVCEECLIDIFNPQSRFYRYPFTSCTNCGPRYTLIKKLPYDRERTTLQAFKLCSQCQNDYNNPSDRRYHAEGIICPTCGPQLSMPISEMARALENDKIIAVKSLGGFQLLCNAQSQIALQNLRQRKRRDHKPFALMAPDVPTVKKWATLSKLEQEILTSRERPIVLLKKTNNDLPSLIAPGLNTLGFMLPYTPFHHLLLDALPLSCKILVVTSANVSGWPILYKNEDAEKELASIVDEIVTYNRDILTAVDDSVIQIVQNKPCFLRRARGYTPQTLKLPRAIPSTLALGGHLKNTFCITRQDEAFISQYIGDLDTRENIQFFEETLQHLMQLLEIQPERVAHDTHPDFYTTRYAATLNLPSYPIQHHRAHVASLIVEQNILTPCLSLVLDGYGYGDDGDAWGGELFYIHDFNFELIGHLHPFPIPYGDISGKKTWINAVSILNQHATTIPEDLIPPLYSKELLIQQLNHSRLKTRSCGRLFDAAAALLKISDSNHYEGQAAMMMESLVKKPRVFKEGWIINENKLDFFPLLYALKEIKDPRQGSEIFHGTLARGFVDWIAIAATCYNVKHILLTGGCLQNKVLATLLSSQLREAGWVPIMHHLLTPNDGGLSLGQAWLAGNMSTCA